MKAQSHSQTVEINLGKLLAELLAKAINTKAKTVEKKEMQIWKKFLILSAGFLFIGSLGLTINEAVLQTVGIAFIFIGIICLFIPVVGFIKILCKKFGILKMIVAGYLLAFTYLMIVCNGKTIMILIMWAIALPYLLNKRKFYFFRFNSFD